MLPFTLLFVTCRAGDSVAQPVDTADPVQQQVVAVQQAIDVQVDRLIVIERFLSDQALVKEGKAPKGWVQPPFDDYMKPGAPVSTIPAPTPAVVVQAAPSRP